MGRILLSICAVVVAAGLGASAQQPPQGKQHPGDENAAPSQQPPIRATEPKGDGKRSEDQAQAQEQPSPLDQSDLAAQWAMAGFAGLQVLLTFGGLLYIRWTLKETRKAVTEAAKATKAAQDAVAVTRESAEKQIRAYVSLDTARIVGFKLGDRPRLVSVIKNAGVSPATKLRRRLIVGVLPDPYVARPPRFEFELPDSSGLLGSGAQMVETIYFGPDDDGFVLTQDHLDQFARREWGFWVGGWIIYEDVFKRTRRTTFRGGATGQKPSEDGVLNLEVLDRGGRMS